MNDSAAEARPAHSWRDPKKLGAYVIVAILLGILAVQYARAVAPAAQEDRTSPCRALNPQPFNPRLGRFPAVAPPLQAPDYTGQTVGLDAYRGRVVFLNFWQTTCPPCKEEMPSMEVLQRRYPDLAILALASEADFEPVKRFFPQGTQMTILLDKPEEDKPVGPLARSWGTEKWPETYLIDKRGIVRFYYVNSRQWDSEKANACIESLLAE